MADMQFTAPSGGAEESYGMSGSMSATAAGGAAGVPPVQMFSDSSHPIACVFHLAFKAAAFVLYIFGSFLAKESKSGDGVAGSNFVVLTVVCILLSAADFWVVKNVRLPAVPGRGGASGPRSAMVGTEEIELR